MPDETFVPPEEEPVSYNVHDNEARPFRVVVWPQGGVLVLGQNAAADDHTEVVTALGASAVMAAGHYGCGNAAGQAAPGNTVLVREEAAVTAGGRLSYVWIGCRVVRFWPPEVITAYTSTIGNSDVPYPIAYSANYVWFFAVCGRVGVPRYNGPLGIPHHLLGGIPYAADTLHVHGTTLYDAFYGINGWASPGLDRHPAAVRCETEVIRRRPGWEAVEDRQDAAGGSDDDGGSE